MKTMQGMQRNAMDLSTALAFLATAAVCYAAWLTSVVFCAANGVWPLLIAVASFFLVGIVHGVGIWCGGW
jgi:hypothetical protein